MTDRALDELLPEIESRADRARRLLVGLAGPPGVGKSTVAAALADRLGPRSIVLGMDGFHLADEVLADLGLADVKGAPATFDAAGFVALLERVRTSTDEPVYAPAFDRPLEAAIAGRIGIEPSHDVVIVEGNYLLLDGPWAPVRGLLDLTVSLRLDDAERRRRLIDRHVRHGRSPAAATAWVDRSDEANARLVVEVADRADHTVTL